MNLKLITYNSWCAIKPNQTKPNQTNLIGPWASPLQNKIKQNLKQNSDMTVCKKNMIELYEKNLKKQIHKIWTSNERNSQINNPRQVDKRLKSIK